MPRPNPAERRSYQKRIMPSGFPQVDTDKFNPSDYFLDQYYLHGLLSDILHRFIEIPVISSGLVVTNSGNDLLISAGAALCGYGEDGVIPHNNDGSALTARSVENLIGFAYSPGETISIAGSGAVGDGVTLNAVRARAVWEDDETRNYQSNPLSSYPFLRVLRLEFAINPGTPADYPLHLGEFICTLTGPTVSGYSYVSTARADSIRANFEASPRAAAAATLSDGLVRLGELTALLSQVFTKANFGGPEAAEFVTHGGHFSVGNPVSSPADSPASHSLILSLLRNRYYYSLSGTALTVDVSEATDFASYPVGSSVEVVLRNTSGVTKTISVTSSADIKALNGLATYTLAPGEIGVLAIMPYTEDSPSFFSLLVNFGRYRTP